MTIFIDQDNTLADYIASIVKYLKIVYGHSVSFTAKDCKEYNVLKNIFPFFPREQIHEWNDKIMGTDGFWIDMPPLPNVYEVMKYICSKHDVYICTVPWPTSKSCIPEKIEWVRKYLPFFDIKNIIFCNNKDLLKGDIMVEDNPMWLSNTLCPHKVIFDYPYNKQMNSAFRVKNWLELLDYFEKRKWFSASTNVMFCDLRSGDDNEADK
jgi:5'(3')-deoxyribonucleotidase